MANEQRGEVSVVLNGVNYVLRPTFEALAYIEGQIGKSLFTLLSQFSEKGITLNEQITIIKIGAEASGTKINLTDQELGKLILKTSLTSVIATVCKFVQKGLGL
jgi:hypothetical protein